MGCYSNSLYPAAVINHCQRRETARMHFASAGSVPGTRKTQCNSQLGCSLLLYPLSAFPGHQGAKAALLCCASPGSRAGVPAACVSGTASPGSAFGIATGGVHHWGKQMELPAAAAESLPPAEGRGTSCMSRRGFLNTFFKDFPCQRFRGCCVPVPLETAHRELFNISLCKSGCCPFLQLHQATSTKERKGVIGLC